MWNRQPFETCQRRFVNDWLEPGMTVLDIGANQGLYTLMASRKCGPSGRVIAFEPCRVERLKLRWNLAWNGCKNVTIQCKAVGRAPASDLVFYAVVGAETGGNSLRPPAADLATATKQEKVGMTSVDVFCEASGIDRVHFVKLDVEGGELDVLHGSHHLLSNLPRPVMLLEVSDVRTAPWGYAAREVVSYLADLGYTFFEIGDSLLIPHIIQQTYHKDLLVVPAESVKELTQKMKSRGWSVLALDKN